MFGDMELAQEPTEIGQMKPCESDVTSGKKWDVIWRTLKTGSMKALQGCAPAICRDEDVISVIVLSA